MAVPKAYLAAVSAASQKYGVPAKLLAAQIQGESNWNPNAKSPAGAIGLSQFMPGTAAGFGINPHDPLQSIDAQGRMMHNLLTKYHGNEQLALAAYNAGSGAVDKAGGKIPNIPETQKYVKTVQGYESNYPGLSAGTVAKAAAYHSIVNSIPSSALQTAPKTSSQGGQGDSSSQSYDPSQALLGYLTAQSQPGHGANDPTSQLMSLLANNQASLNTETPLGPKAIPIDRTSSQPVTKNETKIVGLAEQYLGVKYKWGGTSPTAGFDCSGFVQFVNHLAGNTNVPRTTYQQLKAGQAVAKNQLKPGDAVFFNKGEHVGMYIGNGKFIQSPHTGDVVKISDLNTYPGFYTARRFGK